MPRAHRRVLRRRLVTGTVAVTAVGLLAPVASSVALAAPRAPSLDVGNPGLRETRTVKTLSAGVTLTTITRGVASARSGQIQTTQNGPWRVQVATIDPKRAKGALRTAIGADLARTETVSTLGAASKSVVAVNASFFSHGRKEAPGDPVGLSVNQGVVVSEPMRVAGHTGVLMDSATKKLTMGQFTWQASLSGPRGRLAVGSVNTPPKVPAGCQRLTDPAACGERGSVVRFTPRYAARTPSGPGAEVVLDAKSCVVAAKRARGTRLASNQTSIQATGSSAAELLRVAGSGCPTFSDTLLVDGTPVTLSRTTYGVNGRYRLVEGGRNVAPTFRGAFFNRHPRTIVGHMADGTVRLVTIDGRSTSSVGATITEAARIARSLGMVDAVNVDGGGSTTMAVNGKVVNRPAGGSQRAVGDAIVYIPPGR